MIDWTKLIPRWGGEVVEPPESKKNEGYLVGDKPPAKWENWLRKGTYEAVTENRQQIENVDGSLVAHKAESVHLGNNEFVRVRRNTNQTIPNNENTPLSYNEIVKNEYGMFNLSKPTEFICVESGVYLVTANIRWLANATGLRRIRCSVNGQPRLQEDRSPTASITEVILNGTIELAQGDKVTFDVLQNSGGALDIQALTPYTPSAQIVRVG